MKNRISLLPKFLLPLALSFGSFGLYFSTLAPGILRGDSGEFQWAMASLNVAHATGYPLFTLLGYAWLQLPIAGAAAWRLNLLSGVFGAAAVVMVYILSREITRRSDAALVASIFFALAPVFWFNASILEVYTLNAFFLALILYLLLKWANNPSSSVTLCLAFLCLGFALAHHRMIILAVPGIFVFMLLTDRRLLLKWRLLILLGLLTVPGLALYLYVPIRLVASGATLHYAVFDIVLGQEFSGSLFREFNFMQVFWQIPAENFHSGLVLAAFGAIFLFRRQRHLAILLLLVYVADVAFALAYWVPDVQVFLTPSFVVLALWIAAGTGWLIDWLGSHVRPSTAARASLGASVLLILFPFIGLEHYPSIAAQVSQEAGNSGTRARTILSSDLPLGALLELDWETATAMRFLQTTEGTRRDLEPRLIKINDRDEYAWVLKNVDSGRSVFVERGAKWTRAAAGYLVQTAPDDLAQITLRPVKAIAVSEKIDDHVQLDAIQYDEQALVLYWVARKSLSEDLATYVHFFDSEGHPLGQEDHGPCCEAVYGYRTTEWQVGREIADTFRPAPAGTTYLQIGMYALDNGDINSYGRTIALQIRPVDLSQAARSLSIRLGDSIIARGYELSDDGKNLSLTVYWEASTGVPKDYSVFVHSLDADGKILKQVDREPLDGVYPTGDWKPGQIVRDTFVLPSASGEARVEFGLYETANGHRLTRADGGGDTIAIYIK